MLGIRSAAIPVDKYRCCLDDTAAVSVAVFGPAARTHRIGSSGHVARPLSAGCLLVHSTVQRRAVLATKIASAPGQHSKQPITMWCHRRSTNGVADRCGLHSFPALAINRGLSVCERARKP